MTRAVRIIGAMWIAGAVAGCSVPEPGAPVLTSTPLFGSFGSYRTLDDIEARLPARSTWQILTNSKQPPRSSCPKFDQPTFVVAADHLGFRGRVQLTFINDRLEQTIFTPDDFSGYVRALEQNGVRFDQDGGATLPPATHAWRSPTPVFVGWEDRRLARQVSEWISACS